MTNDPISTEFSHDGRVVHILLNRPQKKNALNRTLLTRLHEVVEELEGGDARAVILRGAGGNFSAGADLGELYGRVADDDRDAVDGFIAQMHATLDELERLPIPTVAVVEGMTLAGGLETMLACDIVVSSDDAVIGDQHANYGLIPGGGGTQRLPEIVGRRRAKELVFTGRRLAAAEAAEWGLVNQVVDSDALDETVDSLLDTLASKSSLAAGTAKHLIDSAGDVDSKTGLELERKQAVDHLFSDDAREGFAAFDEGREPDFS